MFISTALPTRKHCEQKLKIEDLVTMGAVVLLGELRDMCTCYKGPEASAQIAVNAGAEAVIPESTASAGLVAEGPTGIEVEVDERGYYEAEE